MVLASSHMLLVSNSNLWCSRAVVTWWCSNGAEFTSVVSN